MRVLQGKALVKNLLLVLSMAAILLGVVPGSIAGEEATVGLFAVPQVEGSIDRSDDPVVVRARYVDIDAGLLVGADGTPRSLEPGSTLALNLFEDVTLTAVLDRVEVNPGRGYTWLGHVEDLPYSQVTLVLGGGQLAGNVAMPDAFYQVRYAGDGAHVVYEIDQSAYPPEVPPVPVEPEGSEAAPASSAPADGCTTVDVMVVYTTNAKNAVGNTAAMENLIDVAVAESNTSYANSGITQRLNLVHTAEVSYTATDFGTALSHITGTTDGYMDDVHTWRDTYGADEVVLIINHSAYCGMAWLMTSVDPGFEDHAFAVVYWDCATGYYSFAHELGHNMGARHDWFVDEDITPYPYNHGYVNFPDGWRTIMAYNSDCSDQGGYCSRLQYWSNPDVLYGGDPMGVPEGTSTSCTEGTNNPGCDADNRKTLNNTACTVANFRQSQASPPPNPPTSLSATAISETRIDLSWIDNSSDETGFKIERSPNGSTGWTQIALVGANTTFYPNTGLTPDTLYYYRVRATNANGDSAYSNVANARTLGGIVGPLEPVGYRIDDDNTGDSSGNGNGVLECGETAELFITLRNWGTSPATGVNASVSTVDPYVSWIYNLSSPYNDIPGGGLADNLDDFDLSVSATVPWGHIIRVDVQATSTSDGPWSSPLYIPVLCSGTAPEVAYLPLLQRNVLTEPPVPPGFSSSFNGSAPGWEPHSGTWWIDSGAWYTTDGLANAVSSASFTQEFANLDYRARVWRTGCEICGHGIMIRGKPEPFGTGYRWDEGYAFYIARDGYYTVMEYDGGVGSTIQAWTYTSAITQGDAWNEVWAVANGTALSFYINGTLVWSGSDSSFSSGRVGLLLFRNLDSIGNQFWADWAELAQLGSDLPAGQISPEQQALNEAAASEGLNNSDMMEER